MSTRDIRISTYLLAKRFRCFFCLFFIVTETYDVSYDVDPIYSRIDAIFVLRKQKRPRNGRLNPISYEVVYDLYSTVKKHLESDWSNIGEKITNYGRAI